jgi:hypothetical protein
MAWIWKQSTGELSWIVNGAAKLVTTGYSGHGNGINNPNLQQVRCIGPIPQGDWHIVGPPVDTSAHGPYVLHLIPSDTTQCFGRSGFLMHGDSVHAPGMASEGCVIVGRPYREEVWQSGDTDLKVIA